MNHTLHHATVAIIYLLAAAIAVIEHNSVEALTGFAVAAAYLAAAGGQERPPRQPLRRSRRKPSRKAGRRGG